MHDKVANRVNRLPQEFSRARNILKAVKTEGRSLNNELYNPAFGSRPQNIAKITSLVAKALYHNDELDSMLEFLKNKYEDNFLFDKHKTEILLVELFWGTGCLPQKGHNLIQLLNENAEELSNFVMTSSDDTEHRGNQVLLPRYVRINVLKVTEGYVLRYLEEEGWELRECGPSYSKYLQSLASLTKPYFMRDFHYPELLAFPPGTHLHHHPLFKSGAIVMQAKSTCIPVKLLNPQPGSVVLDMCAAPGMKTSQLAAHMNNIGEIHAVEFDADRYQTLQQTLQEKGVTCAKTYNKDVLEVRPHHIPNVTHILVDPSCSGSGMQRIEMKAKSDEQVQKLAAFQFRVLCLALTFPQVRRIVYSTCSVLPVENEAVVSEAIAYMGHTFKVVDAWPDTKKGELTRGDPSYPGGELCIYLHPEPDLCTGFFVAVLERNSKKKRKHKEEVEETREEPQEKKRKTKHLEVEEESITKSLVSNGDVKKSKKKELSHSDSVEDGKEKKNHKTEFQLVENTLNNHKRKNEKYRENQEDDTEVKGKKRKHKIHDEADEQRDLSNSVVNGRQKRKHEENYGTDLENPEPVKERKKKKDKEHREIENLQQQILPEPVKKKKKKDKNHKEIESFQQVILPELVKEKKKKKRNKEHWEVESSQQVILPELVKEKKKEKRDKERREVESSQQIILPELVKEKKRKKRDKEIREVESSQQVILPELVKEKKKKKIDKECREVESSHQVILPEPVKEKKKKKRDKELREVESSQQVILPELVKEKKKKKDKKHLETIEDEEQNLSSPVHERSKKRKDKEHKVVDKDEPCDFNEGSTEKINKKKRKGKEKSVES